MQHPFPQFIAHRGACAYTPENTLIAFKTAAEKGAKWVEFDVRLTADGELIVFHDDTLDRTTNGRGIVARIPYAELAHLDAGSWFNPRYRGERIPRFEEVVTCLEQYHLGANIEMKSALAKAWQTGTKTVEAIHRYWPTSLPAPLVSSFNVLCLYAARRADPEIALGLLLSRWYRGWERVADYLKCISIHVHVALLTRERAEAIKRMGRHLFVYTVNDAAQAAELFSWGVDAVFSDSLLP